MVLTLGGNGFFYYRLSGEHTRLQTAMEAANRENLRLAGVKAAYLEKQKQAEQAKRRVEVIAKLKAAQTGPVNLLATIGDTINNTEAVWLTVMKDDGNNINVEGVALSNSAVANLMANLKKTGHFKNIELKETYQDETVKNMQAFNFTLICEKQKS